MNRNKVVLLAFLLCAGFLIACTSRTVTVEEATPTPEPTPVITEAPTVEPTVAPSPTPPPSPSPTPSLEPTPNIVITKHPNDDPGIIEGNTQISIARAENADLVHWQFTPPDESVIYTDQELEAVFPVKVYKIDSETLWVVSIPVSMDGYKVRAVFANDEWEVCSKWASIHVIGFFTQIPHSYTFCSGVGAWSTEVQINNDGSFTGYFHDWDAFGPDGIENYQIECSFSGRFGRVGKIADHIYTMELLSITQEGIQGERFVDETGLTHEVSRPYGFDNASLFYVYTPGIPLADLQDGFREWMDAFNGREENWAGLYDLSKNTFEGYGLYNYYGQQGFFQSQP